MQVRKLDYIIKGITYLEKLKIKRLIALIKNSNKDYNEFYNKKD